MPQYHEVNYVCMNIIILYYCVLQVESFSLDQDDVEDGESVLDTSKFLLSSEHMEGADLRNVDPETQAKLEALLEAAGRYCSRIQLSFTVNRVCCYSFTKC